MATHDTPSPEMMVEYLENTLIPDLHACANHKTAQDFEDCLLIIKGLMDDVSWWESTTDSLDSI